MLSGVSPLPPLFSLGYHQCRWNYLTQLETQEVSDLMSKHEIPCDSIWLDIEYTDKKKYFTWDKEAFPNPRELLNKIVEEGRKLITIIDPHIKMDQDYFVS